jgi:hypothetical protein
VEIQDLTPGTRNAVIVFSLKLLGLIRAAMLFAGAAAVLAAFALGAIVSTARDASDAPLGAFGLEAAVVLLAASIAAGLLMPRRADIVRPVVRDADPGAGMILATLLAALAAAAALQIPHVLSWIEQDRMLLTELTGDSPDPLGLDLIPAAILYSLPAMAAAALAAFALTSVLGLLAPAESLFYVLISCITIQAGLVAGEYLLLQELRDLGTRMLAFFASAPDADLSARAADWIARHDTAAGTMTWRLFWILGAYAVAAATSELLPRRGAHEPEALEATAPREPAASAAARVAIEPPIPAAAGPPAVAAPESTSFDYSNYSVRPRRTFLDSLFFLRNADYDIQTIPPMSRARFSFSWTTGALRREPNGPDIAKVRTERQSLMGTRACIVTDAATGAEIGRLVPNLSAWEIIDPVAGSIGRIEKTTAGSGFATYRAIVREEVVTQFTWGMPVMLSHGSELEVEFPSATNARFDRAFMIAVAPLLEEKIRIVCESAMRA